MAFKFVELRKVALTGYTRLVEEDLYPLTMRFFSLKLPIVPGSISMDFPATDLWMAISE